MERKEKCLGAIILAQTGGSLCDIGVDLDCFIESQSAGRDQRGCLSIGETWDFKEESTLYGGFEHIENRSRDYYKLKRSCFG